MLEHEAHLIVWLSLNFMGGDPIVSGVGIYSEASPTSRMMDVPAVIRTTTSFESYGRAYQRMLQELQWALDHSGTSPLMEWAAKKILGEK